MAAAEVVAVAGAAAMVEVEAEAEATAAGEKVAAAWEVAALAVVEWVVAEAAAEEAGVAAMAMVEWEEVVTAEATEAWVAVAHTTMSCLQTRSRRRCQPPLPRTRC